MKRIEPFTTAYGTKIESTTLIEIIRRIKNRDEHQAIITEVLRTVLPEHDNDIDEAYEVYDYCQDFVDEEEINNELAKHNHNLR